MPFSDLELPPVAIVPEGLVDGGIDGRRLVLPEHFLPDSIGTLGGVLRAFDRPLLIGLVVGDGRLPEGSLEIALGMGAAEEMRTRPDLADGVQRLAFLGKIDGLGQELERLAEIGIQDHLLIAGGEPALQPADAMGDVVHPGEKARLQGEGAFIGGLGVGDLGSGDGAAGAAHGHPQPARQLRGDGDALQGFRRAEGRRAGLHGDGADEGSHGAGRAGPEELHQRQPGHGLGELLGQRACQPHRPHGARQDIGRDQHGLVGPGIDLGGRHHGDVEDQGRVGVQPGIEAVMGLEEILAEDDLGHLDGVVRRRQRADGASDRLVGIMELAVEAGEMALGDRNLHQLAGAAGDMQAGQHLGNLQEVEIVLGGRVAPALVEVVHEGRAAAGREDDAGSADMDGVGGVAGMLQEVARCGRLDQRAGEAALEADALALDIGPRRAQQLQRLGIAAELHADLLQDRIGITLDELQAFFAEQAEQAEGTVDIGQARGPRPLPRDARGVTAPLPAPALCFNRRNGFQAFPPSAEACTAGPVTNVARI